MMRWEDKGWEEKGRGRCLGGSAKEKVVWYLW